MARQATDLRRPELHIAWLVAVATVVIGAGTWVGVPSVIIPMALLFVALTGAIAYIFVMFLWSRAVKAILAVLVAAVFGFIGYSFWSIFTVEMNVRIITGSAYPGGGEDIVFAVELTNKGKATSLTKWRAILVTSDGKRFEGEPLRFSGDSVQMAGANNWKTSYKIPECDLRFQTIRALQTGDSAYGLVSFVFRDYPAQSLPLDMKIILQAKDMLGRTITSRDILVGEVDRQPRDVFPCAEITQSRLKP
jgi:hypothetical protein